LLPRFLLKLLVRETNRSVAAFRSGRFTPIPLSKRMVIDYAPRPQFISFHEREERFTYIVAHRRAGKIPCIYDAALRNRAGHLFSDRPSCAHKTQLLAHVVHAAPLVVGQMTRH
jgi:hypothetical protein